MDERMGLNSTEGRELKLSLGSTFSGNHAFHTLKYDFKPASVDLNKEATVEVGSNNQVQVTVPHLDGSGVPKTIFKGNQKKYTKECVLILDKNTGEFTLERLTNNISVKKTRNESAIKGNGQLGGGGSSSSAGGSSSATGLAGSATGGGAKLHENSTQRTVSKTKVSTGVRKTNNAITGFMPRHSPNQVVSLNDYPHHKSPQSAPAWHANNGQSTLPSIPMIDDDVTPMMGTQQPTLHHQQEHNPAVVPHHPASTANAPGLMSSSDSSSESSYSSDSDSSHHSTTNVKAAPPPDVLKEDLCLSESNSDSD